MGSNPTPDIFFRNLNTCIFYEWYGWDFGCFEKTSREILEKKIEAGFWGCEGRDIGLSTKTVSSFKALSVRESIVQT